MKFSESAFAGIWLCLKNCYLLTKRQPSVHSSIWRMLKRVAAIFFVLLIAGNAWAAVCGCIDGGNRKMPSCCKKQQEGRNSMAAKQCCGGDCFVQSGNSRSSVKSEPIVRLSAPQAAAQNELNISPAIFAPAVSSRRPRTSSYRRPHLPPPPNLYIKHHSILI
ncbi:MAG: hypothetical protein C4324_01380 [Blastocatellia bacterium]